MPTAWDLLCQSMLLLNAAWDCVSALAIWGVSCTKDVTAIESQPLSVGDPLRSKPPTITRKIASLHLTMWTRHEDSANHAACMLMAWWVITLGCMRLLASIMWGEWLILAMLSYGIESALFLSEGLKSTMIHKKACPTCMFSMVCLCVCVMAYFH